MCFSDSGKGRAIVFLHGFLQNKEVWKKFTSEFPKRYRIICIDLPAHGQSSTFGYLNSMSSMADAVKAVLDSLKLRRYILVGHSMGGYVALAFAEKYTDHIHALVLMNSTAEADSTERKKSRSQMAKLLVQDKERILEELVKSLFNRSKRKPYRRAIKKLTLAAKMMSYRSILSTIEGMKRRREREIIVKFASYPVLYLIGEKDPILDPDQLIQESKLAKQGQFEVLKGVGHMAMVENHDRSRQGLLTFLRKFRL